MEHDDRPPVATFFCDAPFTAGSVATLGDAQAHHARVKRLDAGDAIRLTDGAGNTAIGSISALNKSALDIDVARVDVVTKPPLIHLRVPIGDRERMLWLAEKATELGVSSWQGVRFRRSASVSPRGEGPAFAEKVRARMIGALEQSGGAWLPEILPDTAPERVSLAAGDVQILLDAAGEPPAFLFAMDGRAAAVVLFGPEGGIESQEREALHDAGWRSVRLAGTTLRFETAGLAAVSVLRAAQLLRET